MTQTSGLDLTLKVKTCFDCKMFDVANWLFTSTARWSRKDTFTWGLSVSSRGALEISSVIGQPHSLIRDHSSSPKVVAEPCKHDEGHRPSPKDHIIQIFTYVSNEGWGAHLEQASTKGACSDREKRPYINVLELKAVSLALKALRTSTKIKQCWLLWTTQEQ